MYRYIITRQFRKHHANSHSKKHTEKPKLEPHFKSTSEGLARAPHLTSKNETFTHRPSGIEGFFNLNIMTNPNILTLATRFLVETQHGTIPMSPELAGALRQNSLRVGDVLRAQGVSESVVEKLADCYTHLPPNGILTCVD